MILVKVGSVPHPMEEEHFIEWVEVVSGEKCIRKTLKPGDAPEVKFCDLGESTEVRAYCNVHGLWKA